MMDQTLKRFLGTLVIFLPVIILVIWWCTMAPFASRFIDLQTTLLSLGRVTGLVGLGLYSISLILHVRIAPLKVFLDAGFIVKLHHILGSLAFILLLVHPLSLAMRFVLIDPYIAAKFLIPTDNLVNLVGLVALAVMTLSMIVTLYFKSNHTLWLWVHRSMLVAYLGSFIHLLFVSSDTSQSPGLKYYVILLMTVGILAFTSQRLAKRAMKRAAAVRAQV